VSEFQGFLGAKGVGRVRGRCLLALALMRPRPGTVLLAGGVEGEARRRCSAAAAPTILSSRLRESPDAAVADGAAWRRCSVCGGVHVASRLEVGSTATWALVFLLGLGGADASPHKFWMTL